jgi:hypothetical protein
MFHARICTAHDAFHIIAEVNPYNLQTLRHHLRQSMREGDHVKLSLQIDPSDRRNFDRFTARWLPGLIASGTEVEMDGAH